MCSFKIRGWTLSPPGCDHGSEWRTGRSRGHLGPILAFAVADLLDVVHARQRPHRPAQLPVAATAEPQGTPADRRGHAAPAERQPQRAERLAAAETPGHQIRLLGSIEVTEPSSSMMLTASAARRTIVRSNMNGPSSRRSLTIPPRFPDEPNEDLNV